MAKREQTQRKGVKIIQAHPGFQERFIRSNIDVVFGGGVLNPQPLTSSVLTPYGFVKLSDISVGDTLYGFDRTLQYIVHKDNVGEKECIRITLEDGSQAECSLDHKWWVLKDGVELIAISFELLEGFQVCRDRGNIYGISLFRSVSGMVVPVRITDIEEIGMKECICIGVSNNDELYITDDCIFTKNCGKAQPYNARVLTPDGYKYIGRLKEGDIISCTRGGTQKVEKIYEKGIRDIYKITLEIGQVECCTEHLWYVLDSHDCEMHTLTTEEMIINGPSRYFIPCPAPVWFTPRNNELKIDPYTLGRILGKGRIDNAEISDNMRIKLSEVGITDEFFIPDDYKFGEIRERMDLLRGFIDEKSFKSEDSKSKMFTFFIKTSFIYELSELIFSLGGTIIPREKYRDNTYVEIIMPYPDKYYSSTADRIGAKPKIVYRHIESIKFSRQARTRCIQVSDESHLYITNDYVCTHNTYAAVLMVAEPSLDPLFRACFTRRNLANLKAGGGILDEFKSAYGDDYIHITASENPKITFPSGSFVDCIHIANEEPSSLMERAKGWQYDCFYLDELTSYAYSTFKIVGTRCRGQAQWSGKLRGTTNPKRSHWTRRMLDWYIGLDGFVDPSRDGMIRYYYQLGDTENEVVWGDTPEEVYSVCKPDIDRQLGKLGGKWDYTHIIRSFTFYAGKMSENKAMMSNNPSYIASVAAVGGARAQQLIEGNFNVDEEEGDAIPIPSRDAQLVFVNDECRNGDYWITVDLADVGTDNLVALYWDGFHCDDIMILSDSTPRQNYERIKLFATRHNVPDSHVIYDGTHGTYMYDYMPDAKPFISASSPIGMYALMSDRLKDECYLRLIDVITHQRMSFSSEVANSKYRHHNIKEEHTVQAEFLDECSVVRMRETPRGRKKLLTKKEMNALLGKNRSMDLLDPCAMRMYPYLAYQYGDELNSNAFEKSNATLVGGDTVDVWNESTWY